mmetsp:Transcript_12036/g.14331  ORF Transcript_12036/g.14331 Transcript_12036/m.14331 type:complete len:373 (+) Transcript_12036:226-1344(+)|eukprot:CAMPEP_0197864642 /NCGR_PEP_ID=MMETSP1438-20131217/43011_1 /TAXON_ID=1461541 /ORGANISM="Pterosperma sp., Strain CCMP1384" /LENGTH=372 /DNA_ID=CAMNT_0043482961 /DNA_START=221 /DNA_END=1339 /DNA_ORIENTATION=-
MRSPLSQFANLKQELEVLLPELLANLNFHTIREVLVALLPAAAVLGALLAESKSVAALAQTGGINTREYHAKKTAPPAKGRGPRVKVSSQEKLTYTLGVVNVGMTTYIVGHYPDRFFIWHTVKYLVMFFHRWVTFRRSGDHYFLVDFCYWANWLSLLYCWHAPHSTFLFRILFVTANGPLAWSVLAFNNSLIFHSAAHMTSSFIHMSPMMLTYALRWNQSPLFTVCDEMSSFPQCKQSAWQDLVKPTVQYFYLPWAIIYSLVMYVILAPRLKNRGYTTLYTYVSGLGGRRLFNFVSGNVFLQQVFFMTCHYSFAMMAMLLACMFWHDKLAHTFFVLMICMAAAWNGAGYYLRVMGQREALLKDLQQQANKEK